MSLWTRLAHRILNHPRPIVGVVVVLTLFFGYWATQVKPDYRAANFSSSDDTAWRDFRRAGKVFGRSETLLYVVFQGANPYDPAFLGALDSLTTEVSARRGVDNVLSLTNVPVLVRDGEAMATERLYDPALPPERLRARLQSQPFLRGILLSQDGTTAAMMVRINAAFNDTSDRIDFVEWLEQRAAELPGHAALAGFPVLRTHYALRVTAEMPVFTILSLLISLAILFLTFRAWRAVSMPTIIVLLGSVWTFGLMGFLGQHLNIVTSILPALLVIIGMANVIHLTTKFFDQYAVAGDRRVALRQTIQTVGLATFLTSLTTAVGFGVLVLSGSRLLTTFGAYAALGIMLLYALSITLIPFAYLRMRPPRHRPAAIASLDRFANLFEHLSRFTQRHSTGIVVASLLIVVAGLAGISQISSDIFVFSDFYKDDPLRKDLATFEESFGGVLPLEIVIDAKKEGQFRRMANLRRIQQLQDKVQHLEPVGTTVSAVDLVKMGNQAFFGGNPRMYRLPSSYELPFLQRAYGDFFSGKGQGALVKHLPLFIDSTFTLTRIYAGVDDIGTTHMNVLADSVEAYAARLFPADQFDVFVTGTAIMSTHSGESLVRNLLVSLAVALLVISLLMAALFRSVRLTAISLAPNILPLLIVGGTMGFAGITLKPSTALIFSLAFGIAVDDTIHFLAKYRINRDAGIDRDEAIRKTLRETGKAILFTSLILMAGFLVFTLSSFGGTVSMGALTALTLGIALVANLLLLPALLFRYGPEEHGAGRRGSGARAGDDAEAIPRNPNRTPALPQT